MEGRSPCFPLFQTQGILIALCNGGRRIQAVSTIQPCNRSQVRFVTLNHLLLAIHAEELYVTVR